VVTVVVAVTSGEPPAAAVCVSDVVGAGVAAAFVVVGAGCVVVACVVSALVVAGDVPVPCVRVGVVASGLVTVGVVTVGAVYVVPPIVAVPPPHPVSKAAVATAATPPSTPAGTKDIRSKVVSCHLPRAASTLRRWSLGGRASGEVHPGEPGTVVHTRA
jgi:hypothetical protein